MPKLASNSPSAPSAPAHLPVRSELAKVLVFDDPKHHIRLYQGDCPEILEKIPENSVDLVFADPPLRRGKRRL